MMKRVSIASSDKSNYFVINIVDYDSSCVISIVSDDSSCDVESK